MKLYWLVMAELSYSIKGTNGLLFITLPNCFNIRCKWVPVILLDCLSLRMQDLKGHKAPVSASSRLLFVSPAGSQTVWWQQGSRSWASHDAKALECIPRRMTTVPANSRQSTLGAVWNTPHPHPQSYSAHVQSSVLNSALVALNQQRCAGMCGKRQVFCRDCQ